MTVRSATGAAIAGGIVTVYTGPSCGQRLANLRTNSRGRVSIAVLAGQYCVAFAAAPHGYRTTAKVAVTAKGGIPISVSAWAPYAPITVTIRAVDATTKARRRRGQGRDLPDRLPHVGRSPAPPTIWGKLR